MLFIIQYFSAGAILGLLMGSWRRAQLAAVVGLVIAALVAVYGMPSGSTGIPTIAEIGRVLYALYVAVSYIAFLIGLAVGVIARELYRSLKKLWLRGEAAREGEEVGEASRQVP